MALQNHFFFLVPQLMTCEPRLYSPEAILALISRTLRSATADSGSLRRY